MAKRYFKLPQDLVFEALNFLSELPWKHSNALITKFSQAIDESRVQKKEAKKEETPKKDAEK